MAHYESTCEFLCVCTRDGVCQVRVYIFTHFDEHHLIFPQLTAPVHTPLHPSEESQFKLPFPASSLSLLVFSCQARSLNMALKRRQGFVSCHLTQDMHPLHTHHSSTHVLAPLLGTILLSLNRKR